MSQVGGYGYGASATTSESRYADGVSRNPSTAASTNYAGLGAGYAAAEGAQNFPQAHPTGEGSSSGAQAVPPMEAGMSSKQREAYQESQRFHVQNPSNPYAGEAAPGPVTVHTDGGAYTEAQTSAPEIPPTYDSIRR